MSTHDDDHNKDMNKPAERNFFSSGNESQQESRDKIYGGDNHQPLAGHMAETLKADTNDPNSEKAKKKRTDDLLLKLAAEDAIKEADKALEQARQGLSDLKQLVDTTKDNIDRADYLKNEIIRAQNLVRNGSAQEKNNFLLEHGITQNQINTMSPEARDLALLNVQGDMIEEYGVLKQKIEHNFDKFAIEKTKIETNIENAEQALEVARDKGAAPEEIQQRQEALNQLKTDLQDLKENFGQTMVGYYEEHGAEFDTKLQEFLLENKHRQDVLENNRIAQVHFDDAQKISGAEEVKAESLAEHFNPAADGVMPKQDLEHSDIVPTAPIPNNTANTGLDF